MRAGEAYIGLQTEATDRIEQEAPLAPVGAEKMVMGTDGAMVPHPTFQQQGWPIGSGMVESANKLVVEARLKGAGMHWERRHVDAMLGLRNIV